MRESVRNEKDGKLPWKNGWWAEKRWSVHIIFTIQFLYPVNRIKINKESEKLIFFKWLLCHFYGFSIYISAYNLRSQFSRFPIYQQIFKSIALEVMIALSIEGFVLVMIFFHQQWKFNIAMMMLMFRVKQTKRGRINSIKSFFSILFLQKKTAWNW